MNNLIAKLEQKRIEEGSNHKKFAKKINMSSSLWQMSRYDKRNTPKPPVLVAIAKNYPDLIPDLLMFLGYKYGTVIAHSATPVRRYNQRERLSRFFSILLDKGVKKFKK